jgi:hypothetical protein
LTQTCFRVMKDSSNDREDIQITVAGAQWHRDDVFGLVLLQLGQQL